MNDWDYKCPEPGCAMNFEHDHTPIAVPYRCDWPGCYLDTEHTHSATTGEVDAKLKLEYVRNDDPITQPSAAGLREEEAWKRALDRVTGPEPPDHSICVRCGNKLVVHAQTAGTLTDADRAIVEKYVTEKLHTNPVFVTSDDWEIDVWCPACAGRGEEEET